MLTSLTLRSLLDEGPFITQLPGHSLIEGDEGQGAMALNLSPRELYSLLSQTPSIRNANAPICE
jgi:hypothetical protein